jgi:hypothetical protein
VLAPPPDVAMFIGLDVWDGDNGSTVTRTGLEHQAVYRFDSLAHRVALPMGGACCLWGFAPSPTDGRVAFGTYGADPPVTEEQRAVTGVKVIESDGSPVAWFAGSHSPCWSRDGTRLAMVDSRAGADGRREPVAVRIVDRSGRSETHSFQPQRIAWGNGDTLFLEFEDRVEALAVTRAKSWRTGYAGCQVSADGRFSFRYRGQFMPFRVRREAGGVELGSCVQELLGIDRYDPRFLSAFWVRSEARRHLLCLSFATVSSGTVVKQANGQIAILTPGKSPPRQEGVRTVVIDPETFEVLQEIPGKVVAPANDHRSLVMLLGDTLSRARLPAWPPEPARAGLGRIHMQVRDWGRGLSEGLDTTVAVATGDWLPGRWFQGCDEQIRVVGMNEDSRLELHVPPLLSVVPNGSAVRQPTPFRLDRTTGRRGSRVLLGATPVRLSTNSVDGGYDVVLAWAR